MKILTLLCALLLSAASVGQQKIASSETPAFLDTPPVLFSGPSQVGDGYRDFAPNGGGGLLLNSSKPQGDFEGRT